MSEIKDQVKIVVEAAGAKVRPYRNYVIAGLCLLTVVGVLCLLSFCAGKRSVPQPTDTLTFTAVAGIVQDSVSENTYVQIKTADDATEKMNNIVNRKLEEAK